jgi:hypothetical protein
VAVLTVALRSTLRRTLRATGAAGDERGQPLDIAVVIAARLRLMLLRLMLLRLMVLLLLGWAAAIRRLIAWREELRVARQIGLRIAGAELLLVRSGHAAQVLITLIAEVIALIRSATLWA